MKTVYIIYYELIENPLDDWGVEEVCKNKELADFEVLRLSEIYHKYHFIAREFDLVGE